LTAKQAFDRVWMTLTEAERENYRQCERGHDAVSKPTGEQAVAVGKEKILVEYANGMRYQVALSTAQRLRDRPGVKFPEGLPVAA
jgi:hypothetical protein